MKVAIYQTSDLHGYVYPTNYVEEKPLGILKICSYILEDEKKYDASLKVDCGDLIQGSALTQFLSKKNLKENPITNLLMDVGYNAFVLGNHEFNYGLDYLKNAYKNLEDKIINANINGLPFKTKPYNIFNINGFKIAFIGFTTSFIPNWESEKNIEGMEFLNPVEVYKQYEDKLKEESDMIILCYHGGFERSLDGKNIPTENLTKENQGSEFLEKYNSIDIILSGHQHRSFIEEVNNVICTQPMNNGQSFVKLVIDTETKEIEYELIEVSKLEININKELESKFKDINEELNIYLNKIIGDLDFDLKIDDLFEARLNGHPFINLIHNVQLDATGADFSALPLFDSVKGFEKKVTIKDIIVNFPYPNTLKVLKIKGSKLKEAIEKSVTYFVVENNEVKINKEFIVPKIQNYNYDMFAGLKYEVDLNREFYDRVISIKKDDVEIDLDKEYTIVMNSYRATNTSVYPAYKDAEVIKEVNMDMSELIINYFQNNNRIIIDNEKSYIFKW